MATLTPVLLLDAAASDPTSTLGVGIGLSQLTLKVDDELVGEGGDRLFATVGRHRRRDGAANAEPSMAGGRGGRSPPRRG
jgi:hypothetical protein